MRAYRIRVTGQVQGVGFRPHVWRQAQRFAVLGEVLNDGAGVAIHAQGGDLDRFVAALEGEAPALAVIDGVEVSETSPRPGLEAFKIAESAGGRARVPVTPDVVICADCRAEIADPKERRYRYPFANCTQCGPRFSIIEAIPYDRPATTMRAFEMCGDCRSEYEEPADRRFHAQPIACPVCGPRVWVEDLDGRETAGDDASLSAAVAALRDGAILAIKGLGGFHLACDALNEEAVARLRRRKQRPDKPFALMAPDIDTIARYSLIGPTETAALEEAAGPIVLLEALGEALAPSVAPGQWSLGWMLPPTPLHVLLMEAHGGPLVMTSGNLSGEPQVIGDAEAREKLTPFVDVFLTHDRDIARRLDDSVVRVVMGESRMQRRARGYAPSLIRLPDGFETAPAVAAYGAFLKAALCLTRDGNALLSHHIGDLGDDLTAREFAKADIDYRDLMDHRPEAVACDAHPDYPSTATARARADALSVPLIQAQHHHAHIAAVMAERGWAPKDGPVLGVAMDGLGYGEDGTVWGGEWLLTGYDGFERLAWLKSVPLPGGTAAQREPWRNLLAQLDTCGEAAAADALLEDRPVSILRRAVAKGVNAPLTSSCGRLFDAFAALIGVAPDRQTFEGQAAMALETLARRAGSREDGYAFDLDEGRIDPGPMWRRALADRAAGISPEAMAAKFHASLAACIAENARRLAAATGARAIALSGGCFQNATLLEACLERLAGETVLTHRTTPPNDGGIALGQAAIAARKVESG